jgi:hypothetical protein
MPGEGLASDGLASDGLASDGFASEGLTDDGLASDGLALAPGTEADIRVGVIGVTARVRSVPIDSARCALSPPAPASPSSSDGRDGGLPGGAFASRCA